MQTCPDDIVIWLPKILVASSAPEANSYSTRHACIFATLHISQRMGEVPHHYSG